MVDFNAALRTTLLLVDDDAQQLELRTLMLKKFGFNVWAASSSVEALSIIAQSPWLVVDVAVLDYDMPAMNGCVLADYLRTRYPKVKIILHSGAVEIPEREMRNVDAYIPKGDGPERLLKEVSGNYREALRPQR